MFTSFANILNPMVLLWNMDILFHFFLSLQETQIQYTLLPTSSPHPTHSWILSQEMEPPKNQRRFFFFFPTAFYANVWWFWGSSTTLRNSSILCANGAKREDQEKKTKNVGVWAVIMLVGSSEWWPGPILRTLTMNKSDWGRVKVRSVIALFTRTLKSSRTWMLVFQDAKG